MKEFEKNFPKPPSKSGMINDDPLSWWYEKQEGWKAALEWALSCGWPHIDEESLESRIERELKDET